MREDAVEDLLAVFIEVVVAEAGGEVEPLPETTALYNALREMR